MSTILDGEVVAGDGSEGIAASSGVRQACRLTARYSQRPHSRTTFVNGGRRALGPALPRVLSLTYLRPLMIFRTQFFISPTQLLSIDIIATSLLFRVF